MSNSVRSAVIIKKKLTFKGSNNSNKSAKAPNFSLNSTEVVESSETMTESEMKFKKRKLELEKKEAEKMAGVSYRQRVENFNAKLSKMTEHNDIPRISAAGNG